MKERISEYQIQCKDCQWYRPQWGECCFGGGWGHYPEPEDWCDRYFDEKQFATQKKIIYPTYKRLFRTS